MEFLNRCCTHLVYYLFQSCHLLQTVSLFVTDIVIRDNEAELKRGECASIVQCYQCNISVELSLKRSEVWVVRLII